MKIRKSQERGHFNFGWLDTYHSFSFGNYYDPENVEFRALRVINEDRVAAGQGFDTHPHKDMEIITLVQSGHLVHQDSLGNRTSLGADDVQVMTAGSGIRHSEFNGSETEELYLFQIWIKPNKTGLPPSHAERSFQKKPLNELTIVASLDGRDNSLKINQDALVGVLNLERNKKFKFNLAPSRFLWLQVASGIINIDDIQINKGDGVQFSSQENIELTCIEPARILSFELS